MNNTEKPVAIVSGASRGIGKAIALLLNKNGYQVVGLYIKSDEQARALAKHDIDMIKADVGQEAEVQGAIDKVKEKYGRLDIVVNNAGIDVFGPIETYSTSNWKTMLATNISSVFLMSRFSIALLKHSYNPVIINISSRLGIDDFTEPDFVVYGAVKAAVNNFTVGLSKELFNTKIRVNAVIPAPTKTDLFDEVFTPEEEKNLIDKGNLGTPEEVAHIVLGIIEDNTVNGRLVFDKRLGYKK